MYRPPVLGEPLPIELANTRFVRRGRELDGLATPAELSDWLARVGDRLPVAPGPGRIGVQELAAARALRDALRTLLADVTRGVTLDADAVEVVNRTARAAPRWYELSVEGEAVMQVGTPSLAAVLGAIAEAAVMLLSGADAAALRACAAPNCVLFYRKDHPRRTSCSPACANRARAARHYARRTGA